MTSATGKPAGRTVSIDCAAPPEAAWALLADPRRWPQWARPVRRVTITRGHDAQPPMLAGGQLLVVHGPRAVALRTRIDRVERGRRYDWTVDLVGPWSLHGMHAVEPTSAGCRLVADHHVSGPGASVARPASAIAARWSRRSLCRLARLAEQR